jgi:hypothetical protein
LIEGQDEAQQGAGRMPVPQRARRPRYLPTSGFPACRLTYQYARTDVKDQEKTSTLNFYVAHPPPYARLPG